MFGSTYRGKPFFVMVMAAVLTTGCGRVFNLMYGTHFYNEQVTSKQVARYAQRMDLPPERSYVLRMSYYDSLKSKAASRPALQQALVQPLQLRYYDREGHLVALVANCHVGGSPNLKWDRFHISDSIPARKLSFLDSAWTSADDAFFHIPVKQKAGPGTLADDHDYHISVYWTYKMGRQSRRLKRLMDGVLARHGDRVSIQYVNADSLFMVK